ncbi:MAG TPA: DMT family transporter [Myxococcales bacterium]|nr:DMT family transporter [Myxococcales bacterium]
MADLALAAVMAIWGSSFAVIRFFLGGTGAPRLASPLLMLAARMGLATVSLAGFMAAHAQGRAELRRIFSRRSVLEKGSLLRDGVLCGSLLGVGFLLQIEGLQRTTASRSGFLTGLLVVFTPLFELLLFRKRPAPPALAGVLLAFAGMALLAGPTGGVGASTASGDTLTVGCALVFALHIIALGRVTRRHALLPLLLVQLATVWAIAAVAGPLVEAPALASAPRLWLAIAYLALFATLLAFGVQTWAQRKLAPVRVALLSSLEPVFAALWASLLLGEQLAPREKLGGALIVLGVAVGEVGTALFARVRPAG